jgi:hypothetical protein
MLRNIYASVALNFPSSCRLYNTSCMEHLFGNLKGELLLSYRKIACPVNPSDYYIA